jgi:hypothetical protein
MGSYFVEPLPAAHPLSFGDPQLQRVSKASVWSDPVWSFRNSGGGRADIHLNWDFEIVPGARSLSSDWSALIELGRHALWSLWAHKEDGLRLSPATLPHELGAIRLLMRWMAATDHATYTEINAISANEFIQYIQQKYPPRKTPYRTVIYHVSILEKIFKARDQLTDVDGAVMQEHPYGGKSARSLTNERYKIRGGSWLPLDDRLFLETMNAALTWLDAPARDVTRLVDLYWDHDSPGFGDPWRQVGMQRPENASLPAERVLLDFVFDDGGALATPWRSPLVRELREVDWTYATRRKQGTTYQLRRDVYQQLFRLIETVAAACTIVIQGTTGIRLSELCGLEAEPQEAGSAYPACVRIKTSEDGLTELFLLKSTLLKKRGASRAEEWLAGSRPTGTKYLPPSIRAIIVLGNLFKHWRAEFDVTELALSIKDTEELREFAFPAAVADDIRIDQKSFIAREVDIDTDDEDYWNIGTHQWRKTFAVYSVRVDEIVIPALADHFKQLSIGTLEQAYIGDNPELLGMRKNIASRELARTFSRALDDGVRFAGRMGKLVERQRERLEALLPSKDDPEARHEALMRLAAGADVGVWPSDWGKCVFRPETSRCHQAATGAFDYNASSPHYGTRRPGLCSGCANLMIGPEHAAYWRERHRENLEIYRQNAADGDRASSRVAAERARNSENILKSLGLQVTALEWEADDVEPF